MFFLINNIYILDLVEGKSQAWLQILLDPPWYLSWNQLILEAKKSLWYVPKTSCPWSNDQVHEINPSHCWYPYHLCFQTVYLWDFVGQRRQFEETWGEKGSTGRGQVASHKPLSLFWVWLQMISVQMSSNYDKHEGVGGLSHFRFLRLQSYSLLEPWQLVQKPGWTRTTLWACGSLDQSNLLGNHRESWRIESK